MKAVVVRGFGGPEVLEFVNEAAPAPRAGQVLVRVEAAAINPVDAATVAGVMHQIGNAPERAETGVGWDLAGVVEAVGPDIAAYAAGDKVVATLDRVGAPRGAFATHAIVNASSLAHAPRTVDAATASTLPLPGLTAWQSLERLGLEAGRSLLVTGAAGVLGSIAVQLAAARGIEVVAQGSPGDEEYLRSIGATHVVARDADLGEAVREAYPSGVDGVVDAAVRGIAAFDALRNGGGFVSLVGPPPPPLRGTTVHAHLIHADGGQLAELVALVDKGDLSLRVAGKYPLDQIGTALGRFLQGGLRGRLVLEP